MENPTSPGSEDEREFDTSWRMTGKRKKRTKHPTQAASDQQRPNKRAMADSDTFLHPGYSEKINKYALPQNNTNRLHNAQRRQKERESEARNWFFKNVNKLLNVVYEYSDKRDGPMKRVESKILNIYMVEDVQRKTLKQIFHILQYCLHFMDTIEHTNRNGRPETAAKALQVRMNIGGELFKFALMDSWPESYQIYVNFPSDEPHSYTHILQQLDEGGNPDIRSRRADAILRAIKQPHEDQPNWTEEYGDVMDEKQMEAARELIVLTHIAEAAAPDWDSVEEVLKDNMYKRRRGRPNDVLGGIGGMDKRARACLENIRDKKPGHTFHYAFNDQNGEYIVCQKGGVGKMKNEMYSPDQKGALTSQSSIEMSSSSETGNGFASGGYSENKQINER